jgi:hypothetical protein
MMPPTTSAVSPPSERGRPETSQPARLTGKLTTFDIVFTVLAKERSATLAAARAKHPEHFNKTTDPKILALPVQAWINQPKEITEELAA